MKGMRFLPVILMLVLIGSVCATSLCDCFTSHSDAKEGADANRDENLYLMDSDEEGVEETDTEDVDTSPEQTFVEVPIPACVKRLLDYADWWADTFCVVDGTAYYWAYEDYGRCNVIFNKDKVLLAAPILCIDSFAPGCDTKFYVSNAGKSVLVDFSDKKTLERLNSLSRLLPSFTRYRKDSIAGFGRTVFYSFAVDFPNTSIPHSNSIRKWLVKVVERSQSLDENIPDVSSLYIGYSKRPYGGWTYSGSISDNRQVARFATNLYFAIKKGEYGTNQEDYPSTLFADLNLQAMVYNKRYVTYQEYTHDYNGGAHGFYTERLVSYDHVYQQEIDYDYLFKPDCKDEVLTILLDEAKKTPQYKEWEPNIMYYVKNQDEDGNGTGELVLPTPGLSEEGVVFSFQPYSISCFAAGPFHFTIPYSRVKQYLTTRGKWCVGLASE
jgi:hypothetical protein